MCGISGIVDLKGRRPIDRSLVRAMNDTLVHRGPDGEGFHFEPGVGFGHRRLSIIDLAGDDGERNWYSAIETLKSEVELNRDHEISNGISQSFTLEDEFYYKIRFKDNDSRLTLLLEVPELETIQDKGKVVAWCVERTDGGRGFATTTGHFFDNWQNHEYRTLMLNAIAWSAGLDVPDAGVKSDYFTDAEVTDILFGKSSKALILTGNNHPAHDAGRRQLSR